MEVPVDKICGEILSNYKRDLDAFFEQYKGLTNRTVEELELLFVFWAYKRRRRLCLA